jgi:hypothetical protein
MIVLKRKPAAGFWQRVLEIVFALIYSVRTRSPARHHVVVMPVCMMAVIVVAKHCSGLIPD